MKKVIVLTAAVGMLGATAAVSQTTDQQQMQPQTAPQSTQPMQPPVGTPPSPQAQTPDKSTTMPKSGQASFLSQQQPDQMLASNLMRQSITGANNERIGQVDDLVISPDGQIQAVLVGVGGFLGIGQKTVAIPFDVVNRAPETNQLSTRFSRQDLEQAPEFVTIERDSGSGTGTGGAGGTRGTPSGGSGGTAR